MSSCQCGTDPGDPTPCPRPDGTLGCEPTPRLAPLVMCAGTTAYYEPDDRHTVTNHAGVTFPVERVVIEHWITVGADPAWRWSATCHGPDPSGLDAASSTYRPTASAPAWITKLVADTHPATLVEVLVDRDPDGDTSVYPWFAGRDVTGVAHTVTIDPGRGWSAADWAADGAEIGGTLAFRAQARLCHEAWDGGKFTTETWGV